VGAVLSSRRMALAILPVLGFLAVALMIRRPVLGLSLGALFYLPQTFSYTSSEFYWGLQSGLKVVIYMQNEHGKVAVNLLAVALLVAHIALVTRRVRGARAGK